MGHGQRVADGDRGIDRIAALAQDGRSDIGGEVLRRHDHAAWFDSKAAERRLRRRA